MAIEGGILSAADSELQVLTQAGALLSSIDRESLYQLTTDIFAVYNRQMGDLIGLLAKPADTREYRYGGATDLVAMHDLDEFGKPSSAKINGASTVAFPIKKWGRALGWNSAFFKTTTIRQFDNLVTGLLLGDRVRVIREIRSALFRATNYNFTDPYDGKTLGIKALANADGAPLPIGPNGEVYNPATHTHYMGSATHTAAAVSALIANVTEHFSGGKVELLINSAQIAGFTGLAGFVPATYSGIIQSTSIDRVSTAVREIFNVEKLFIGVFNGVEVYSVYWVPASYMVAMMVQGADKPLAYRIGQPNQMGSTYDSYINGGSTPGPGDFSIVSELDEYPFYAQTAEREIGFGGNGRVSAACLFIGNATYQVPTF